jgi:hypothetical protein
LGASAAQATAECGYCCTRNCRNRGRTPQSSRFRPRNQYRNNRYRISTNLIGDAKRAESEEQRGCRRRCRGWKNRHPPSSGGPTFPTTPRAQCVCGKIHLADDNFPRPRPVQEGTLFCNLRWLSIQRAIVIGIDAGKHPWHALGRGVMNVGHGTGVHAGIRSWRLANFAAVGLMTTSLASAGFEMCGRSSAISCPRHQLGHALPLHRGRDRAEASNYPSGATESWCTRRFRPTPPAARAFFREFSGAEFGVFLPSAALASYFPSLAEVPDGPP